MTCSLKSWPAGRHPACSTIGSKNGFNNKDKRRSKIASALSTNKHYWRYQMSENALFIAILLNTILSVSYCQSDMVNAEFKNWFLWTGYYFHFLCIFLTFMNEKIHYDYQILYEQPKLKSIIADLIIRILFILFRPYPQFKDLEITFELSTSLSQSLQTRKINHILAVLGLGQSFFFFVYLFNTSKLKNNRSNRICSLFNCKVSNIWVIRGWFIKNNLLKLFGIFFASSIVFTSCFRLVEYRYNPRILYVQNSLWLTFTTMFCIGYGDLVTQTNAGKCIGLISMYSRAIFTYFLINLINNFFKLGSDQKKTLNQLNSLENKQQLRVVALKYIRQSLWRVWRNYRNRQFGVYYPQSIKQIKLRRQMRLLKTEIRKMALKKAVYSECIKGFQDTFALISDLKNNQNKIFNWIGKSFQKAQ